METPPLWLMRQAGRYLPEYRALRERAGSFLALCYTPELATEATLQPVHRFGVDAAILFSDILVVADALGRKVEFEEGRGPLLPPLRTAGDIAGLDVDRALGKLGPVFATVSLAAAAVPPGTALIGFAGAPWTVATYMVEGRGGTDFAAVKAMAREETPLFRELIRILTEITAAYLVAQIDHGAELLQLFDSWAGMLSGEEFTSWVIEPTREIVRGVKAARPGIPIIGFPRGAGSLYPEYAKATGVDAVSLDQAVAPGWAARAMPDDVVLQGNLDPLLLEAGGAAMDEAIDHILSAWKGRRFIFNLGHGVLPATPPAHVARLVARVRGGGAGR